MHAVIKNSISLIFPQVEEFKKEKKQLTITKKQLQFQVQSLKEREADLKKELTISRTNIAQLEGKLLAHRQMIDSANGTIVVKVRDKN